MEKHNDNDNQNLVIPIFAFEKMQSKDARNDFWRNMTIIVMAVIIILLLVLHFISDARWRKAWSEYDYVTTDEYSVDLQADDGGDANYIGNNGDISYGTSNSNTQENEVESAP